MKLSRERLMLTNLLDRFPEVTHKFANIENSEHLGEAILDAFRTVLGSNFGLAFVLEGEVLRVIGRDGIDAAADALGRAADACRAAGVTLLIDPMSMQYLMGAEVDYTEGLQGAQFVIRNPNASTTCGCGSSFSI